MYFSCSAALLFLSALPLSSAGQVDTLINRNVDSSGYDSKAGTFAQWISVQRALAKYMLALDNKDFSNVQAAFTPDVYADYQAPIGVVHGAANVTAALEKALSGVETQHSVTTLLIDFSSTTAANTTADFIATLFGTGNQTGKYQAFYGVSRDAWVLKDGMWKVNSRNLTYRGPGFGNLY